MSKAIIKKLKQRQSSLQVKQQTWEAHWEELSEYILPSHGRISTTADRENDGAKRYGKIFNSSPEHSMGILAAGMQSGLTSPSRPWFKLGTSDPALKEFAPIKDWLHQVETSMLAIFAQSNIYNALHHCYLELGTFGTAVMSILEDFDNVIWARPYTVGEYLLGANAKRVVDTVYRTYYMTAMQLIDAFGVDNVSATAKKCYEKSNTEQLFSVTNAVEPNDDRLDLPVNHGRAYRSIYFETDSNEGKLLKVGGFDSFPYICPRWHVVGADVYGHSPGMSVLADAKSLMQMEKSNLIQLAKNLNPPKQAPPGMKGRQINDIPGGITYADSLGTGRAIHPLNDLNINMQHLQYSIQDKRQQIGSGLFTDLFTMISSQAVKSGVTATEMMIRDEEKMLMLGPVLERLHLELLDPIINRAFDIMITNEIIPPAPEELQGEELKVEYISILAQAQKSAGTNPIQQMTQYVGAIAGINPQVLDKFNADEAVEQYGDALGIPPNILRTDEEVGAIRGQRAQQERLQQNMDMASQAAKATKDASVDVGDNSTLKAIMGQL